MKSKKVWITDRLPQNREDVVLLRRYDTTTGWYDVDDKEWCSDGDVVPEDDVFGWYEPPSHPDLDTAEAPRWKQIAQRQKETKHEGFHCRLFQAE